MMIYGDEDGLWVGEDDDVDHRCRKFFTFWERGETLQEFLSELQLFGVSRSKKRLTVLSSI
jgi:hypothetical protein